MKNKGPTFVAAKGACDCCHLWKDLFYADSADRFFCSHLCVAAVGKLPFDIAESAVHSLVPGGQERQS